MSGRTPSAARTSGTPSIIMSPDPRPWTQIRLGAGTRNDVKISRTFGEAADDLNHTGLRLVSRPTSMRWIRASLAVRRPRFAPGAPPRPRLRVHRPKHGRNEARTSKNNTDPNLYGGPQHR